MIKVFAGQTANGNSAAVLTHGATRTGALVVRGTLDGASVKLQYSPVREAGSEVWADLSGVTLSAEGQVTATLIEGSYRAVLSTAGAGTSVDAWIAGPF